MLTCIDKQGHVILVVKRTNTRTTYIATSRKYRKLQVADNRLFTKDHLLLADDPVTIAEKWLLSPIKMTQEVRKRLEMIIAMKKNDVVAKCDDLTQVPEGADVIASVEDLQGRSLRSLTALFNKLSGQDPVKFDNVEAAAIAVWGQFEEFEVPVKEKKEKERVEREKMELLALPKNISKQSVITDVAAENPRREGSTGYTNFSNYAVGETLEQYLAKEGAHMGHFRWDVERGFITADIVEDVKEPKVKKVKKVKEVEAVEAE